MCSTATRRWSSARPGPSHLIVTARTAGGQRDAGGVSVFLVDKAAKGVVTRDYPTVDGQRASEVYLRERRACGADALIGPEGAALPLVEQVVDEAIAAVCAEAVRRAAPAARGHAGLHQAAQAVRPADRRVPGAAAPHGRHVHPGRAGGLDDLHGHTSSWANRPPSAPRPSPRPRSRSAAPAGSSARTRSSCTAAWA